MRRQLIEQKGYQEEELPSEETIRCRLNEMGYSLTGNQGETAQENTGNRCHL